LDEFFAALRAAAQRSLRIEAQEEHVRAGIDGAQRAIDLEAVDAGLDIEALRENHLESVAGANVLLGALDRGQVNPSSPCEISP
jgi:hypothetical protein